MGCLQCRDIGDWCHNLDAIEMNRLYTGMCKCEFWKPNENKDDIESNNKSD